MPEIIKRIFVQRVYQFSEEEFRNCRIQYDGTFCNTRAMYLQYLDMVIPQHIVRVCLDYAPEHISWSRDRALKYNYVHGLVEHHVDEVVRIVYRDIFLEYFRDPRFNDPSSLLYYPSREIFLRI